MSETDEKLKMVALKNATNNETEYKFFNKFG